MKLSTPLIACMLAAGSLRCGADERGVQVAVSSIASDIWGNFNFHLSLKSPKQIKVAVSPDWHEFAVSYRIGGIWYTASRDPDIVTRADQRPPIEVLSPGFREISISETTQKVSVPLTLSGLAYKDTKVIVVVPNEIEAIKLEIRFTDIAWCDGQKSHVPGMFRGSVAGDLDAALTKEFLTLLHEKASKEQEKSKKIGAGADDIKRGN